MYGILARCALAMALGAPVCLTTGATADPGQITVKVNEPGAKISPMLYGLMTEEINHSYDGGLYGELIQNRIFKDTPPVPRGRGRGPATAPASAPAPVPPPAPPSPNVSLIHWSVEKSGGGDGSIAIDTTNPVTPALGNSLRLDIASAGPGSPVGVANDGYWGIPVKPNWQYKASFYAKSGNGFSGPLTVAIVGNDGKVITSGSVPSVGADWKRYTLTLQTGQVRTTADTRFVISGTSRGSVWFSLVSLFPPTFKDRPNGFRIDLMQLLDDMKPAFLRFPGGNYLEGQTFEDRFNWKATVGPYEQRPGHRSPWSYRSSDGMGLLEFLQWCEDLKMEPVLAVFAGYMLNREAVPAADYQKYADEAVEEIEYITGDASTRWGAQRARDGHPAPFKLTYVEIGNEDNLGSGGQTYDARFTVFHDTIKARYPNLQLIASGRNVVHTRTPDVVDEHYYMQIPVALRNAHMYDSRPRTGPKIFVGEWATRVGSPTPQLSAAVADAAFLTGLERNSDLIVMSCYAPLFVDVNPGGMQWATDLIGFDTLGSYGSPSYYVQRMFYTNRGDNVLPVDLKPQIAPATPAEAPGRAGAPAGAGAGRAPAPPVDSMFVSATRDNASGEVILKIVNTVGTPQQMQITLQGVSQAGPRATGEILTGQLTDVNTVAEPMHVAPKPLTLPVAGPSFTYESPGNSVTVLRLPAR
jgi:alpha-N-arabinofuranosidase